MPFLAPFLGGGIEGPTPPIDTPEGFLGGLKPERHQKPLGDWLAR